MSVVIRAHFDGKVIVPDEPVDLPVDQPLQAEFSIISPEDRAREIKRRRAALRRLASRAVSGVRIPDEAFDRENLYEDRV